MVIFGAMQETILILDFGSQYTQLIARRVRELNVYCEIHPFHESLELTDNIKGVILSGSPFSCVTSCDWGGDGARSSSTGSLGRFCGDCGGVIEGPCSVVVPCGSSKYGRGSVPEALSW